MDPQRAPRAGGTRLDRAVVAALLAWPLLVWVIARHRPPWGDEAHFLETVHVFGRGLSIDLLRAYPEMSAPLTYIVYSAWGHLAGFSTPALRLLSPFIAWATAAIWFLFVLRPSLRSTAPTEAGAFRGGTSLLLLALALVVLNPYFVGLSVFVFTDMLALLGLAMVAAAVDARRFWLAALGLAVATSSRQYLVFVAPALVAVDLLSAPPAAGRGRFTAAAAVGLLALGLLVVLWEGHLAPANGIRETYLSEGVRFDPHALSLYLAAPAAYLFPLAALLAWRASWRTWLLAVLLATFVWFVPVQPSIAQTREGAFTVGFLHRALAAVLPGRMVDMAFTALAAVTLAASIEAGKHAVARWAAGQLDRSAIFAWSASLAFLVVMPFSYMPWEKYALPLYMTLGTIFAATLRPISPAALPREGS